MPSWRIDTNKNLRPCAALALLVFLAWGRSLFNGFVMDDQYIILSNFALRRLGSLFLLGSPRYFELFAEQSWRPMVSLSYVTDYQIWGLAPAGYHLHNLILHALNAVLVFLILKKITRETLPAFIVAGLFAAHTISGEAVNVISFREDLQVAFFMLLAIWALLKIHQDEKPSWMAILWACCFLAVPSKENGILLPLLLAGAGYMIGGRRFFLERRRMWLGAAAAIAASLILRFMIMVPPSANAAPALSTSTIPERILMIIKTQGIYLRSLFYLVRFLPRMSVNAGVAESLLAIIALIFWVLIMRDRRAVAALLFYAVAMIPVANIVPLANPIAFRYLYFPALGLYYLTGLTVQKLFERDYLSRNHVAALLCILFGGLTLYSAIWSGIWKDELSAGQYSTRYDPQNFRAWADLAAAQNNRGFYEAAEDSARRSLRLNQENFYARSALAMSHLKREHYHEAIDHYRRALDYPSVLNSRAEIYFGMAYALDALEQTDESVATYQRAIQINPRHTGALSNLAIIHCQRGDLKSAEPIFEQVLNIDPDDALAHFNMAMLYFQTSRREDARPHLRRVLQLDPQNARAAQMLRHLEQK